MQKSIKKNFIFNFGLTFANMIFPLITAPYISQILGAENIGKVNFANSMVSWFILISSFGIPLYGMREIARVRDDRKKLSNTFWNLIIIQTVLVGVSIVLYTGIIFGNTYFKGEKILYISMILMLVLNALSMDWFYQGIEEYGYITTRNIVVKILGIALIFLMIKEKNDYVLYAIISIIGMTFNNILNFITVFKYIDKKIEKFEIKKYLLELKNYFFITCIIAFYTRLDQTIVGYLNSKDLAFYMRSKMILGVGLSVTNSFTMVIAPRNSYLLKNDFERYKELMKKTIKYIYIISIPCIFGLYILADEAMYLLGGSEFLQASISLKIMTPLILIISLGTWIGGDVIVASKKERVSLNISIIGTIISIILNMMFIKKYSYIGATIVWVIVELIIFILKALYVKYKISYIKIEYISKSLAKYIIAAMVMAVVILVIKSNNLSNLMTIILGGSIGAIAYFLILLILKEEITLENIRLLYKFRNGVKRNEENL